MGIFSCILKDIRGNRHGSYITQNGLRCILTILDSYEDDDERKHIVMAQLASTEIDCMSGMEMLEELYMEENEEIIDLVIEILDSHYGYDEDFFYDSDGEFRLDERNKDYMGMMNDPIYS